MLVRAKNNYCRSQPRIFLKRTGFVFDYVIDPVHTDEQKSKAAEDQVWQFLYSQIGDGRKYSRNTLNDARPLLRMSRDTLRQTVAGLIASGKVEERELPKEEQVGAKKTYLYPVSISRVNGRDIPRDTPKPTPDSDPSRGAQSISRPLRENRRRDIGGDDSSPSLRNVADDTREIRRNTSDDLIERACEGVIDPELLRILTEACAGLSVTPAALLAKLDPEDYAVVIADPRQARQLAERLTAQ